MVIILFGYIVEFPIISVITSRRLVLIVAIFMLIIKNEKAQKIWRSLHKIRMQRCAILLSICTLITFVHNLSNITTSLYGHIEYWYYLFNMLYILVFSIFCAVEFKTIKEFALVWLTIMVVESFAIYYAIINSSFRLFLYNTFYWGDDRFEKTIEWGSRIIGIGIHSASGSLTMSTAVVLLMFLKLRNRINDILFYICFLIIFVATAFIGRTGMIVEIGVFVVYLLYQGHSMKKQLTAVILLFAIVWGITYLANSADTGYGGVLIDWITAVFDSQSRSEIVHGISRKGFPPLSFDSLFGTGLSTGYRYNGLVYSPDSGYIRIWISIGMIGFVSYYLAMYYMLSTPKTAYLFKDERRFILFAIIIIFIVEYKEPFMMQYVFPWFIMSISLLSIKDANH